MAAPTRTRTASPTSSSSGKRRFGLPAAVWFLGLGALLNDTASEAIYPLLPLFLTTTLGASALSLGVIEGSAEAANSLLKIFSGYFSDRWRRRRPIIVAGYAVAALVRPFIAVVASWPQLFAIRFMDRVGKGIRGAPRDAMLASWATRDTRGRVFGFHRAMDHTGAMLGPALATLFLLFYPSQYRLLFALTIIPGVLAVLMVAAARERKDEPEESDVRRPRSEVDLTESEVRRPRSEVDLTESDVRRPSEVVPAASGAGQLRFSRPFYSYLAVLVLFTLGNSTDAFLLLRLSEVGVPAFWIPLLWALLHGVKASVSVVGGMLSDRLSRRSVIGLGWAVYAATYAGFAVSESIAALVAWFVVYGFYYGFSEGTEKALVADLSPAYARGTAFGLYNAAIGLGALAASIVFGYVWKVAGAPTAFAMGASLALASTVLLFLVVSDRPVAA